jgi:fluoroacetyl-CoA thioesterase
MLALRPGLRGQKEMTVEEKDLSSVTGNIGVKVLSTHCLVLLIELASRSVVENFLGEGQMVVGTWIGIRHLAAVPLGLNVRAESTLREILGRRLLFDVVAYDPHEKIAEGSNELLIVSAEKFLGRVKRKM